MKYIKNHGLSFSVVEITPQDARDMLATSPGNRNIKSRNVRAISRDIQNGQYLLTGQPVIIDWNGHLRDGHNRLTAVINSKRPIVTLVVSNVNPESFKAMDGGTARSAADILKINGHKEVTSLAATVARILEYNSGKTLGIPDLRFSNSDIADFVEEHPEVVTSLRHAKAVCHVVAPSRIAWLHYLTSKKHKSEADAFFQDLDKGLLSSENDPVYLLRSRLLADKQTENKNRRLSAIMIYALIIKAWNARIEGRSLKLLRFADGEDFPRISGIQ